MIDTNAVLLEWLKTAGTGLYTLVATRVYCPRLPVGFVNSAPALEVFRRGGNSKIEHAEHAASFQIKCYGGSTNAGDAESVYQALYDRLHDTEGQDTTSGNIMAAYEEQMGQSLIDPETGWPFVLTFWRVTMRPKAA